MKQQKLLLRKDTKLKLSYVIERVGLALAANARAGPPIGGAVRALPSPSEKSLLPLMSRAKVAPKTVSVLGKEPF